MDAFSGHEDSLVASNESAESTKLPFRVEKSPMFTAMHAARYQRQALIRQIQEDGPTLLCYVAGVRAPVDRIDTLGFVDMLHNVVPGEPVDLLLHTPGGDVDAAEKLISLVRNRVGEKGLLRVIVPDFAKSAGTLMALGADTIVMSDSSELGPIDPQVSLKDGNGNDITHSVLMYLDAHAAARQALREAPEDAASRITFEKFDPTVVSKFTAVRARAQKFAEGLLKRRGLNFTAIASDLMDLAKFPSHGQMIGWELAESIGLAVTYMPPTDPLWRRYWALYCHLRLAIESEQRAYESDYVSLILP
jgi:ATP-dependent protease ClpP protease subunit